MAAYLQLSKNGKLYSGAELIGIDEAMCQAFGVSPDPAHWHKEWMDIEGLWLAMTGKNISEMEDLSEDEDRSEIRKFLGQYTNESFHRR